MNEHQRLDFLIAFGEEFCEAVTPTVGSGDVTPQDGFEVFLRVFQQEPNPQFLSSLSDSQLEQLRVGSERYFETGGISIEQLRKDVARICARWPVRKEAEES